MQIVIYFQNGFSRQDASHTQASQRLRPSVTLMPGQAPHTHADHYDRHQRGLVTYSRLPMSGRDRPSQRIWIASAVACDPAMLTADEPAIEIDISVQAPVISFLKDFRDESAGYPAVRFL